jgi:hypothetical protein
MLRCLSGGLLGLSLVLVPTSCGSGGPATDSAVAATPSPEVNGYLDSMCTFLVRSDRYPTKPACVQAIMGSLGRTMVDLASALKAGTVIYHPDKADQCAAKALSTPCTRTGYKAWLDDCMLAFEGTTAGGGTCHSDFECLTGTSCNGECSPWDLVDCCAGSCGPAAPTTISPTATAGDGESCAATGTICESLTSYCDMTSGTCQPQLAAGAKCSYDSSCIGYAACNGGICVKRPGLGENCQAPGGGIFTCLVGGCDQNRVCAMTNVVVQCF